MDIIQFGASRFLRDIGKLFLGGVKGVLGLQAIQNSYMNVIPLPSVTFNRQSKLFAIRTEVLMDS